MKGRGTYSVQRFKVINGEPVHSFERTRANRSNMLRKVKTLSDVGICDRGIRHCEEERDSQQLPKLNLQCATRLLKCNASASWGHCSATCGGCSLWTGIALARFAMCGSNVSHSVRSHPSTTDNAMVISPTPSSKLQAPRCKTLNR